MATEAPETRICNVLTVDVEEWYHPEAVRRAVPASTWAGQPSHVERQTDRVLDLLASAGASATFFVLGEIAVGHPQLVRRIVAAGHEVASHGSGHRMITEMTAEAFRQGLERAKAAIEDAAGARVIGFRAPTFSVVSRTLWALDVIAETGHRYDASIYPVRHDRYGIPGSPRFPWRTEQGLAELPGSTVRMLGANLPVGGGGYLRLLPLRLTTAALHLINRVERQPFVVYFHPWELDTEQPRLKLPFPRVHRHYGNVASMAERIRALCDRFELAPAASVLEDLGLLRRP